MPKAKPVAVGVFLVLFGAPIFYTGVVHLLEAYAAAVAREHIAQAGTGTTPDEKILALTRAYHNHYINSLASPQTGLEQRLHLVRGYLSSTFLPGFIRMDPGVVELLFLTGTGACGNASRALAFVLQVMGYDAHQINIVSPSEHHAAMIARDKTGREMLIDPSYGFIPTRNGRIISPTEYQNALRSGDGSVQAELFSARASDAWYKEHFANATFAPQGARHVIKNSLHVPETGIAFGRADNSSSDVDTATSLARATPYWSYLGHRFDRGYIREYAFDRAVTVVFTLTEPAQAKFVTANLRPTIDGRKVTFDIPKGKTLIFHDGRAPRDFATLRSYQDVDFVTITSMESSPASPAAH